MSAGVLNIERICRGRSLRRVGGDARLVHSTTSTNEFVLEQVAAGASDGFVVFAEHQTAGRGRMGRTWHSPRGASVMASVLLMDTPEHAVPPVGMIGLITGIAAARAIRETTGVDARIEWPNDVLVEDRKLAGVLIESRALDTDRRAYAVGVGINCLQRPDHFPDGLRRRATSLDIECARPVCREEVAGALLSQLDAWFSEPSRWDARTVCDAFGEVALPVGRRVRVLYQGKEYEGEVVEVDPSAALVLMLDDGVRTVFPASGTTVI